MPAKSQGRVQLRILEALGETGPVWIGELEKCLGLRENELRNKLIVLERQGLIQPDRSERRTVRSLREQS